MTQETISDMSTNEMTRQAPKFIRFARNRGPQLNGRHRLRLIMKKGAGTASATPVSAAAAKAPSAPSRASVDVLAGGAARAAAQATIHPLDTIKVRMQAPGKVSTPLAKKILSQKSVKVAVNKAVGKAGSLYKGVWSAAGGAGLAIGAHFAFYGVAKRFIEENYPSWSVGGAAFAAGAIGAAGASIVKVPAAVCIRSVQARVYPNAIVAASRILKAAGPRGLYTGFLPTLLEDVPDTAVKFAVYEMLQAAVSRIQKRESGDRPQFLNALMGGYAGAVAAASTTPLDVIKTRMMVSASRRPNMVSACSEIMREGKGMKPFMSGMGPRALSSFINSAVFFAFFEGIRQYINAKEVNERAAKARLASVRSPPRGLANMQVDLAEK